VAPDFLKPSEDVQSRVSKSKKKKKKKKRARKGNNDHDSIGAMLYHKNDSMEPTVGEDDNDGEYIAPKQNGMYRTQGMGGFGIKQDSDIR
jgi:hypothetical protein